MLYEYYIINITYTQQVLLLILIIGHAGLLKKLML